jgi:nucleoid-associated protein YgaU
MSRYLKREKAVNGEEQYDKLFKKRGVEKIVQYRSPKAIYVTDELLASIECEDHTWSYGDSYEKLAQEYYGSPKEWWVIATFNRKPTESHVKFGDVIRIPLSLADALQVVS